MTVWRTCWLCLLSVPLFGQYAGPAILSRGEAPAAMSAPQINFQPFLEVSAVYDTGLAGVLVTNASGNLANLASAGVSLAGGISGTHSWRHTLLGISYNGGIDHYFRQTYYDSTNHSLLLGLTHELTRHVKFSLRESAGQFSRGTRFTNLQQTVPFDPSLSYTPTTDFFDNRTRYLTSQADLTWQKSLRLSFNVGADEFINKRRSSALSGASGYSPRGDIQYRISRRTTIGLNYKYIHFSFDRQFNTTDAQAFSGSFAVRLTRRLEFSSYGGAMRVESTFVQTTAVDPVIQALLGVSGASQLVHTISYAPDVEGRLSYAVPKGILFASGGHGISTGNGLFLTSFSTRILGGYTYLGLRRWSVSVQTAYDRSKSISNFRGVYADSSAGFSIARQLRYAVHFVAQYQARRYDSPDFSKYNRVVHEARIGFGFTPSSIPLRVW